MKLRHPMIVSFLIVSALLATAAVGPKPKKPLMKIVPLLIALPFNCADADEKAWVSGDGTAFDVDVDYGVSAAGCTASATGKPAAASAPDMHGGSTTGATKKEHFPGVKSVRFDCSGMGGRCWFVVRQAAKSGATVPAMSTAPPTNVGCTHPGKPIFSSSTPKDVLVRVELPKGCTATVQAGTSATVTVANSRFVSFSGVTSVTGGCPSNNPTSMEECKFTVEAW